MEKGAAAIINDRWIWLMNVIFGGIATLAIRRLVELFLNLTPQSAGQWLLILLGTVAVLIFFIYDVTVLYFLYLKFPYTLGRLSAVRLFIDVIMSVILALIILPVIVPHPPDATLTLLSFVTIWHLLAIAWHCLAAYEKRQSAPEAKRVIMLVISPMLLWGVAGALVFWQSQEITLARFNQTDIFTVVCLLLIVISVARSATLIPGLVKGLPQPRRYWLAMTPPDEQK